MLLLLLEIRRFLNFPYKLLVGINLNCTENIMILSSTDVIAFYNNEQMSAVYTRGPKVDS